MGLSEVPVLPQQLLEHSLPGVQHALQMKKCRELCRFFLASFALSTKCLTRNSGTSYAGSFLESFVLNRKLGD